MLILKARLKKIFVLLIMALFLFTLSAQGQGMTEFGVFEAVEIAPGEPIQVPINIRNVRDMYAIDFTLKFDPNIVQVVDADPSIDGIQSALGDFLDPGLLLFNNANNELGTIHFVMSQYNPSKPKSGDGIILIVSFIGVAEGESPLLIDNVTLSSGQATEIEVQVVNSTLKVLEGAPSPAVTYPVTDTTGLVLIGTETPALMETIAPAFTSASATEALAGSIASTAQVNLQEAVKIEEQTSTDHRYWLMSNWWVLVILLVVVVGFGVFLVFSKRKSVT